MSYAVFKLRPASELGLHWNSVSSRHLSRRRRQRLGERTDAKLLSSLILTFVNVNFSHNDTHNSHLYHK